MPPSDCLTSIGRWSSPLKPSLTAAYRSHSTRSARASWLDTERECLVACSPVCIANGWYLIAYQLAWTLDLFLMWRGSINDNILLWQCALTAVEHLRDHATEALVERRLGGAMADFAASTRRSNMPNALYVSPRTSMIPKRSPRATTPSASCGSSEATSETLGLRPLVTRLLPPTRQPGPGRPRALVESAGSPPTSASTTEPRSNAWPRWSSPETSGQRGRRPLRQPRLHRPSRGQPDEAVDYYQRAVQAYRELGDAYGEANSLRWLGDVYDVYVTRREPDQAGTVWSTAVHLFRAANLTSDADSIQALIDELGQQTNA